MAVATLGTPLRTRRALHVAGLVSLVVSGGCFAHDLAPIAIARFPAVAALAQTISDWRLPDLHVAFVPIPDPTWVPMPRVAVELPSYPARPADPYAVLAAPAPSRAFLDLRVNTVTHGMILASVDGDDVAVRADDLRSAGIRFPDARIKPDGSVRLADLRDEIAYNVDEKQLALNLNVNPRDLPVTQRSLATPGLPRVTASRARGVSLDYGITVATGATSGFAQANAGMGAWSLGTGIGFDGRHVTRGLSNAVLDRPERTQRWTAGDAYVDTGELGGAAFVGGLAVQRQFDLDRYGIVSAMPALTGAISVPAVAEIYVNGQLVARERLEPGTYDLRNLPLPEGANATHVVIRDALGGVQTLDGSFYFSSAVLRKGLTDYAYAVGARRADASGNGYGAPVALGRWRLGISDGLTAGARVETGGGLMSGGPFVAFKGRLGEVQAAAAASRDGAIAGRAWSLAYGYRNPHVTFAARYGVASDGYATVGRGAFADRPVRDLEASLGVSLPTGSAGITVMRARDRDFGERASVGVRADLRVSRRARLTLAAQNGTGWGAGRSVYATLTFAGAHGSTSLGTLATTDGVTPVAGIDRPDDGRGYAFGAHAGPRHLDAIADVTLPHLRVSGAYDGGGGTSFGSLTLSGGVVAIDHRLFFTRPLRDQGYALVDVGVPNVQTTVENRPAGRTDAHGELLVTGLLPYYANRIAFAQRDVPFAYEVGNDAQLVAPAYRSGTVVRFGTHGLRVWRGRVAIRRDGTVTIPRYARLVLSLADRDVTSDVGEDGEFEFADLAAGSYTARIEDVRSSCRFALQLPASSAPTVDLGVLTCDAP